MYKIMIVDDEAVVRQGIKSSIQWNEHGFELIGDYVNGRDALEAIELHKPDLVLSDIYMPFMDGLELTRQIQIHYPYIKVIILTGYDNFDYVQQALRLKAYDFIVKPITAKELRDLLDKVKIDMDEENSRYEDISRLQNQLNQSLPLLKERFLEYVVTSRVKADDLEERFQYFKIPWISPDYLVMVIDIDDFGARNDNASEHNMELLRFASYNITNEIVNQQSGLAFRTREETTVVILSGHLEARLYTLAYQLAEEIRYYIEKYLKLTVTVGIGRSYSALDELPLSYKSALSALEYRFLLGKNKVISIMDMEGKPVTTPDMNMEWSQRLSSLIKTGTPQEVDRLIVQLITSLKSSNIPIEACYLQIQKLIVCLLNTVQELGVNEWTVFASQPLTAIYHFKTLDEIEIWLKELCSLAMISVSEQRADMTQMQILRAIDYLKENYPNDKVSLQEISRHVLMSTSYFSLVFKQYTGETFVEYLTRLRIEKAKELLQHTTLKSYEISAKVGYNDPNYFSILFKKHTGSTPMEYRSQ
jgi:two-component system response regulator YesN